MTVGNSVDAYPVGGSSSENMYAYGEFAIRMFEVWYGTDAHYRFIFQEIQYLLARADDGDTRDMVLRFATGVAIEVDEVLRQRAQGTEV